MFPDFHADARDLFDRGHVALAAGDPREAVECFSRAIELRPTVVAGYRGRAAAYLALGRRPDALADLDHAVTLKSDDPALLAERADVLFRQKSYTRAVEDCDRVLSLDPGWAPVRGLRGECHAALGDTSAALVDFAAAIEGDPDHAADYLLARANLSLQSGNFAACITDCEVVLRIAPDTAAAYQTRGLASREAGHPAAAALDFTQALRVAPTSVLARIARAMTRHDLGQYEDAITDCDEVLRLAPTMATAFLVRGMCRTHLGDRDGAIEDFTEAAERTPTHPRPLVLRAAVRVQQGDPVGAVRDFLAALALAPRDATVFNSLAWLWATHSDPDVRDGKRATEAATRACELTDWRDPRMLDTLAAAQAECGDFSAAIVWADQAIARTDPSAAKDFQDRLNLYRQGKPFRAISER